MVLILYLVILSRPPPPSFLFLFHSLSWSTTFSSVAFISPLQTFYIILLQLYVALNDLIYCWRKTNEVKMCISRVLVTVILVCAVFHIFFSSFVGFFIVNLIFNFYYNCELFWMTWSIVDTKLSNLRCVQAVLLLLSFWFVQFSISFSITSLIFLLKTLFFISIAIVSWSEWLDLLLT